MIGLPPHRYFSQLPSDQSELLQGTLELFDGETHDLVVMSHPVAEFEQTLAAYGVDEQLT